MKKGDTWMPLYIGDYLADTSRLTTEQHGAYLLLLMDYWRSGAPPDDDVVLSSIVRLPVSAWMKHRPSIACLFRIEDGKWIQKRAEQEREKALGINGKRIEAGKQGAAKRWGDANGKTVADAMASAMADAMPSAMPSAMAHGMANPSVSLWQNDRPSPSPLPLQPKEEKSLNSSCSPSARGDGENPRSIGINPRAMTDEKRASLEAFGAFWDAYPRKVSKTAALKAWMKINPDATEVQEISDGLTRSRKSRDWLKDGGEFIPYPATWLNGRRWEDEGVQLNGSGGGFFEPETEAAFRRAGL